ncbi:LOW QUALITY PROTEIN: uncharacterized protein [Heptranchias perlo]|uniref:LOW QUALITY PROTEIN: uncharacterized protein n=1 Tax=Heptranchias perlo TaxID=212740 RepID=UPI00355AC3F4
MATSKHLSNLTKDLSCSICLEFFQQPVFLDCGHNFCEACILLFWEDSNSSCPECRVLLPGRVLRRNRQMASIVATVRSLMTTSRGREDGERLNLLCEASQSHIDAAHYCTSNTKDIKRKVNELSRRVELEFAELHQILNKEEQDMKRRLNQREQEILHGQGSNTRATTEINPSFKQVMWNFLMEMKTIFSGSSDGIRQDNEVPVNLLIGEFGGPLQHVVWRQMRKSIRPALTHLTLTPNSAHPSLILSENMTRIRVGYMQQHLPDNPKRFQNRICVLGSKGFTSGKHYWEVEVDQGAKWTVGVVKESVNRKELREMITRNGYWVISPHTTDWVQSLLEFFVQRERNLKQIDHLTLQVNPKKVGVYLDYEGGQVSFYNAEDMSHLYTHSGTLTGKLLSFFSPGHTSNNQMKLLQLSSAKMASWLCTHVSSVTCARRHLGIVLAQAQRSNTGRMFDTGEGQKIHPNCKLGYSKVDHTLLQIFTLRGKDQYGKPGPVRLSFYHEIFALSQHQGHFLRFHKLTQFGCCCSTAATRPEVLKAAALRSHCPEVGPTGTLFTSDKTSQLVLADVVSWCLYSVICSWSLSNVLSPSNWDLCLDALPRGRVYLNKEPPVACNSFRTQPVNMVEPFQELGLHGPDTQNLFHCQEHDEKHKLFCEDDQTAICLVCQLSEGHKPHGQTLTGGFQRVQDTDANKVLPFLAQVLFFFCVVVLLKHDCSFLKEKLQESLTTLHQDLERIGQTQATEQNKVKDLKGKAGTFRVRIESEFAKMHQILHNEEKSLKAKLSKKEKGILMKLEKNIKELSEQSASLEGRMAEVQSKLALQREEAPVLLKDVKGFIDSANRTLEIPATVAVDLRLPEVEGALQHIVWRRMRRELQPVLASLTLNPNTAHPRLTLSGSLTGIQIADNVQNLPNTPERFSNHRCVLASQGFTSGTHYWEVGVQRNTNWTVGVARSSIDRKSLQSLKPGNGYWVITRENRFLNVFTLFKSLMGSVTANPEYLELTESCDKIGVYLDYENGRVSFYNADDMCQIYTYPDQFNEKLYPIFFPGRQMKLLSLNP